MNRLARLLTPPLLLLLLTLALTWPTAITLATHVVDRQDPLLNSWIMAWEAHQLLVAPHRLYDANIFFPQSNALAFSESLLSTSALVMPFQWLTGNALLSYNLAFLLAFFTTALGGYLLALYLTGHRGAALVAAVALAWSPYRLGHLSQVQLLTFGWLPLALLYLDRLLAGRGATGKRWLKDALLFALFFLMQALASFYAALFGAVACGLYGIGWLLWRRRVPQTALLGVALAAALVALLLLPLVRPYFHIQQTLGAGWTLAQNERFSASLQAYGYAPEGSLVWGTLTRPLRYVYGPCCPPDTLFPGLTLLALSGVALWRRGGRGSLWLLLGLIAFGLSLGPTLTVRALEPTGIPLPYRWLWAHLPGFDAIRAPVRWAVLVTLALSMLAAVGVARLRWRGAAPLALALVLVEFAVVPLPLVQAPAPPPSLSWLAAQPPTRLLELPLVAARPVAATPPDEPRRAWELSRLLEAQYFSTWHWHTTPDGYSGYIPARHGDFAREMQGFPSPRSVVLLQGLGVRYVVVHEADLDEAHAARLRAPLPEGVEEVARFASDRVLALAPYSHPDLPRALLPVTELPAAQQVELPLLLASPSGPYVPVAGEPLAVDVRWRRTGDRDERHQRLLVPWPMLVDEVAVVRLPLDTPPSGEWTLLLSGSYPEGRSFVVEQPVRVAAASPPPAPILPVTLDSALLGDGGALELAWTTHQPLDRYYHLSVRLLAPDGSVLAQRDGPPDAATPTLAWQPGSAYRARWELPLPRGAGDTLAILWYDPETGSPVRLWHEGQVVETIRPPLQAP